MPFQYSFSLFTPNQKNVQGSVLSGPYYLYTDPESHNQTWRPGALFYVQPDDVFPYLEFARNKGFFILASIGVIDRPDDRNHASFHQQIFDDSAAECLRLQRFVRANFKNPNWQTDLWDITYCASESLEDFRRLPYAEPKAQTTNIFGQIIRSQKQERRSYVTALYTPQ